MGNTPSACGVVIGSSAVCQLCKELNVVAELSCILALVTWVCTCNLEASSGQAGVPAQSIFCAFVVNTFV